MRRKGSGRGDDLHALVSIRVETAGLQSQRRRFDGESESSTGDWSRRPLTEWNADLANSSDRGTPFGAAGMSIQ